MALATAAAVPDLLSGVIAIDGTFRVVPGWEPPLAPLDGLPVLLCPSTTSGSARPGVLSGPALAHTLRGWGGLVTDTTGASGEILASATSAWIVDQPIRRTVAGSLRPAAS